MPALAGVTVRLVVSSRQRQDESDRTSECRASPAYEEVEGRQRGVMVKGFSVG